MVGSLIMKFINKLLIAALFTLSFAFPCAADVRRVDVAGGVYGDVRVDGKYAVTLSTGVQTSNSVIPYPAGDSILFVRVTPNGSFKLAGQSQEGNGNLEWDGAWHFAGESYGVSPVIYDWNGMLHQGELQFGSQGFRYVTPENVLVTGDATYADPSRSIWEYTTYGDVTIGQGEKGCIAIRGNDRRMLEVGDCRFARFTRQGDALAVAMSKFLEHKVVLLWLNTSDLGIFPIESLSTVTPILPPPPLPLRVDCGKVPEAGQQALKLLAIKFSDEIRSSNDEIRRAWALKAAQQMAFTVNPEWGTKNAGGGRPQSKDGIAKFVGATLCGWDIVNGSTRELSFGEGEPLPGQEFMPVAPFNYLGGVIVEPPPVVDPRIAQLEATIARDAVLIHELEQLGVRLNARVHELEAERDDLKAQLVVIRAELEALKNKPAPVCEAKVPGWLRALGIKIGCVVK